MGSTGDEGSTEPRAPAEAAALKWQPGQGQGWIVFLAVPALRHFEVHPDCFRRGNQIVFQAKEALLESFCWSL